MDGVTGGRGCALHKVSRHEDTLSQRFHCIFAKAKLKVIELQQVIGLLSSRPVCFLGAECKVGTCHSKCH